MYRLDDEEHDLDTDEEHNLDISEEHNSNTP
jgi:hypothetical protein